MSQQVTFDGDDATPIAQLIDGAAFLQWAKNGDLIVWADVDHTSQLATVAAGQTVTRDGDDITVA